MRNAEVAAEFVARINAHDVAGLCNVMADDHLFVEALDNRVVGREAMRAGWKQYFALVPDYGSEGWGFESLSTRHLDSIT